MNDLTMYGDQELSMMVFNTEWLYNLRHNHLSLMVAVDEEFKYTPEQMEELLIDIDEDAGE